MISRFFRKNQKQTIKRGKAKVCKSMKDYSKEDFFVKKVEVAKEVLSKWGLPSELITNK